MGAGNSNCFAADNLRGKGNMHSLTAGSKGQLDPEDKLEPIAIVGMALELPQDATSPESFWQMMMGGQSARSDVPSERFNINGFYHPTEDRNSQVS